MQKFKCAVMIHRGTDIAARLLVGIYRFLDEQPAMEIVEMPLQDSSLDVLGETTADLRGVILWADRSYPWVSRLFERGIAAVNCNRDWSGQPGIVSVGIDVATSSKLQLDHLTAGGRTRQVVAVGVDLRDRPHTAEKCRNLLELAASRGLTTSLYELVGTNPDTDRPRITNVSCEKELQGFLQGLALPAGVWCENDFIARMVCNAAEYLGLAIPDQLAVLGSGDHQIALAGKPTISTIPRRPEMAGYAAAQTLYEWLVSGGPQPPDVVIPPVPVIVRQSTGTVDRITLIVDEARRIIQTEACAGLTVEALCQRLDISKVTLTARFTALLGVSPGTQIRRTKIETAKRLLLESSLSVGKIGVAIGFSDHSKFSKFFRREVGVAPVEFRRTGSAGIVENLGG